MTKWARRRPVIAGLLLGLFLVTILGFLGVTGALLYALKGWSEADQQQRLAEEQSETAQRERETAQRERQTAERERGLALSAQAREAEERQAADRARIHAETSLTFSRQAQAGQMWELNNLAKSSARLQLIAPQNRRWEWHYLNSLHHGELRTLTGPQLQVSVSSVAFSPDGKRLAASGGNPYMAYHADPKNHGIAVWDADTGRLVHSLTGFTQIPGRIAYSPNGLLLASCSRDCTIRIWWAKTGRLFRVLTGQTGFVPDVAWSPDSRCIAGAGLAGRVVVWDVQTGKVVRSLHEGDGDVHRVAWSPNGHYLASCGNSLRVWDARSGAEVQRLNVGGGSAAFSPDSRTLAVAVGSIVQLHGVPDGRVLPTLSGHAGRVAAVAFSPDGLLLATGGSDSTVRVWSAETGREMSVWRGHLGRVKCVCFHPGGWMVASGSAQPGDVRLWDLTRLQKHTTLSDGSGWINALTFSPSGQEVITQRREGHLEARDAVTGLRKSFHALPSHSLWNTPGVLARSAATARTLIATAREDHQLARVWDVGTGKVLPGAHRHEIGDVWHVTLSHDGKLAASAARVPETDQFTCDHVVWEPHTGKVRRALRGIFRLRRFVPAESRRPMAGARRDRCRQRATVDDADAPVADRRPGRSVAGAGRGWTGPLWRRGCLCVRSSR